MVELIKNINKEDLGYEAFEKLKQILIKNKNKNLVIALSGGSSVKPIYDTIKENYNQIYDWSKITFILADERIVPVDNKDSNYKFVKDYFLQELIDKEIICEDQIIPININAKNIAKDYQEKVGRKIDVAILGVGPDSHTCSLFPNHDSIKNESNEFILVENSPKPPKRRISMSKNMVKNVENLFVFFIGENKREAFENFLDCEKSEEEVPVKIVKNCENSFIFTDLN